jgi:hypothetical protein
VTNARHTIAIIGTHGIKLRTSKIHVGILIPVMRAIKYSAAAPIATVRTLKKTLNAVSDTTVAASFCGGGGGAASGAAGVVVVVVDPPIMLPRRPGVVVVVVVPGGTSAVVSVIPL